MTIKKRSLKEQLDTLWQEEKDVEVLSTRGSKYVIISDMHMGNGSKADDFRHNKDAVVRAFKHYKDNGYSLILLGDVEELWQFTSEEIAHEYDDSVYKAIRAFGDDNRVYRVFGNHDIDWKIKDPIRSKTSLAYPVYEGIKLKDSQGIPKILLIHGHQGTKDSDVNSFSSRAFVMLYRYIEPRVKVDQAIAAPKSVITKEFEKKRYNWAKKNKVILICGHTHRAVFRSESQIDILKSKKDDLQDQLLANADAMSPERIEIQNRIGRLDKEIEYEIKLGRSYESLGKAPPPHYFNTGCALYTDGITVIEIANNMIKLVKWHTKVRSGDASIVYREAKLSDIIGQIG